MKTKLTFEESKHLIELGINANHASEILPKSDEISMWTNKGYPIFTLTDILKLLPKEIEVYYDGDTIPYHLVITTNGNGWEVSYYDNEALKTAPELIDALYELLCWVIKNDNLN